jgi:hypothetical protein
MNMPAGAQMIILGRLHLGSNLGVSSPKTLKDRIAMDPLIADGML